MAEQLFRKLVHDAGLSHVHVESAGVSPALAMTLPEEAQQALKDEGVEPHPHRPKGLERKVLAAIDLILTMELRHKNFVLSQFPETKGKVYLLQEYAGGISNFSDVPDPIGGSVTQYRMTLAQIKAALLKILEKITAGKINS